MPFVIFFIFTLLTGTSFAFSIVSYFIILIALIILNVAKIHRRFMENKVVWAILEVIFFVTLFMWFLNIWTVVPATDPYFLLDGVTTA